MVTLQRVNRLCPEVYIVGTTHVRFYPLTDAIKNDYATIIIVYQCAHA